MPIVRGCNLPDALFYDLENLWGDCPRLEWTAESRTSAGSS